jgi:integrase
LHLLALNFVRTSELTHARWAEFDFEAKLWRIPPERMKMKSQHMVPLVCQTIVVLRALEGVGTGEQLLFPSEGANHEQPMSNNAMLYALHRMGWRGVMTGHGFRGVASTALQEMGWPHDAIEGQLAHQRRDPISAAYDHAQYLPQRTEMMQAWADWLDAKRGNAISL